MQPQGFTNTHKNGHLLHPMGQIQHWTLNVLTGIHNKHKWLSRLTDLMGNSGIQCQMPLLSTMDKRRYVRDMLSTIDIIIWSNSVPMLYYCVIASILFRYNPIHNSSCEVTPSLMSCWNIPKSTMSSYNVPQSTMASCTTACKQILNILLSKEKVCFGWKNIMWTQLEHFHFKRHITIDSHVRSHKHGKQHLIYNNECAEPWACPSFPTP